MANKSKFSSLFMNPGISYNVDDEGRDIESEFLSINNGRVKGGLTHSVTLAGLGPINNSGLVVNS